MIPMVVGNIAETRVALERIESFLLATEHIALRDVAEDSGMAVVVENANFGFPSNVHILQGISLSIPQGSLVAVIGSIGCGKSTLLLALAGECEQSSGNLSRCPNAALVTSKPWLLNTTVRENVTAGLPFDEARYLKVLYACALQADLAQWSQGDQTLLGERGQSISGGQRQRVALARACYGQPALALLDDPLSALDPPTAAHVWQHVVLGLLGGATRIVTTGRPDRLFDADVLVVLNAGRILCADEAAEEQTRLVSALTEVQGHSKDEAKPEIAQQLGLARPQAEEEDGKRSGKVGIGSLVSMGQRVRLWYLAVAAVGISAVPVWSNYLRLSLGEVGRGLEH